MNFGLEGRTALVIGPDDGLASACVKALHGEGVQVRTGVGEGVDIVLARGKPRPGVALLDWQSAEELLEAWDPVVEAITIYQAALPSMRTRRFGRFVWVGSATSRSLDAGDDEVDAVVTLAMRAINKVISSEAASANVTANAVLYGGDVTDDDVAAAAAFLCSEGAGYLTGVTITVDGGAGSSVF
jgi:NAD(P)-dependent dehydrogenase (short-subunit alcohol dehydrogenase family)